VADYCAAIGWSKAILYAACLMVATHLNALRRRAEN
jgi:hypothetical protein